VTPLQKVAMGLVIVLVDALFGGYDGVPDPLGWVLVLAGLLPVRDLLRSAALLPMTVACLLVSVATYPPGVADRLSDPAGWALSLPQLAFGFLLCTALAPHTDAFAGRLRLVRWLLVGLALGPVLVLGGGLEALRQPLAFLVVAVQVYLVYLLFRCSGVVGVAATGGPGPGSEA
jgi:hypothetical protein